YVEAASQRLRIGQALPLAQWLVEQVKRFPGVQHVDYAGSLRRGKETIGDLDLLCAADAKHADAIAERFTKLDIVTDVLGMGSTKASVRVSWRVDAVQTQVDLRIVPPDAYGAALLYFTGSKEHNVALRQRAIARGMRLNEYGLFRAKDIKPGEPAAEAPDTAGASPSPGLRALAAATEEEVYRALDLAWIPPELREDHGEIKLAERGELPTLVTIRDIKAELHSHTTASDGVWDLRQWAEVAIARGYHTIAITDHSRSEERRVGKE